MYGALSSLISGGVALFYRETGTLIRIASQVFGAAMGTIASTTAAELVEHKQLPNKIDVIKKALTNGIGAGAGAAVGTGVNCALGRVGTEVSNRLACAIFYVFKQSIEGAADSASAKMITNLCEGKELSKELKQSLILGAIINGSVAGLEQAIKMRHHRNFIANQISDIEKLIETFKLTEAELKGIFANPNDKISANRLIEIEKWHAHITETFKNLDGYVRGLRPEYLRSINKPVDKILHPFVPVKREIPLKVDSVSFESVDCSMKELISHVVLVHTITSDKYELCPGLGLKKQIASFKSFYQRLVPKEADHW